MIRKLISEKKKILSVVYFRATPKKKCTVVQEQKKTIRQKILNVLRNQKEEDRLKKSQEIQKKLFSMPEFQGSDTILFYALFDGEVDTFKMMRMTQQLGKKIALPMIRKGTNCFVPLCVEKLEEDLEYGPYDIQQPCYDPLKVVKERDLSMVVVPGVAFDHENKRLGRGKGFYDRFLKGLPPDVFSVGLAFDFQIVDCLPPQEHDVPVSCVISNQN